MSCRDFNFNTKNCMNVFISKDYQKSINYKDGEGTGIDMTGSTLFMKIKNNKGDSVSVLELTNVLTASETGFYFTDASTGSFLMTITDTDTATVSKGVYVYEINLEDSNGIKSIFMSGLIEFTDTKL